MINVYDFFSGCGGASEGFRAAGFEIKLGVDIDKTASLTFQKNFPNANFINKDIREISFSETDQFIVRAPNEKMLFCGCAPCQPFSNQNRQKKDNDPRAFLLEEFTRFIAHYIPDFIFVENVPGIQKISLRNSVLKSFLSKLKKLGYKYQVEVIPACNYGVPQQRKRLIIIAALNKTPHFPKQTHGPGQILPYSTVGDWIKNLPKLKAGDVSPLDPDHCSTKLSAINIERIKNTPEGGGRIDWPDHLKLNCHKNYNGHRDVYGRLSFNKLSSTITTKCINYSNGRYGHPTQNRAISVREAACLQTFPKNFMFFGSKTEKARQIGNAVPPLLAKAIGFVFIELSKK